MGKNFRIFFWVCLFEGGLGALAWGLGLLIGDSPIATIDWTAASLLKGIVGTLPLVVGLLCLERCPAAAFVKIRKVVEEVLVPLFQGFALWQLAAVAFLAGVGEEILFRGLIQGGLAQLLDHVHIPSADLFALLLASLLFGLLHPLTKTYVLLCVLAGIYLGGLWIWSDNLVVPIWVHAFYDFFALVYLLRFSRPTPQTINEAAVAEEDE